MIILFLYNKKRELVFYLINFAGGLFFLTGLKYLFHRTRPNAIYHFFNEVTPSFPSGHTFTTLILWGLSTYFIFKFLKNKKIKSIVLIFTIIHVLMVGVSRLYLGVHWFSDVIGAYFAGLLWLSVIITGYEYYTMKSKSGKNIKVIRDKERKFKNIFTLILIVSLFAINFYYASYKTKTILNKNVKIKESIEKLNGSLIENIKNGKLKIYSEDIFGLNKIPILIVFQGDKTSLFKMFKLAGFKYYKGLSFKKLILMLKSFLSKQNISFIPIFYNYYDNHPQDYNFVYFEEKNKSFPRIVVKVWDIHKTINGKKIFIALCVEELGFKRLKKRIKLPIISYNQSLPETRNKIKQLLIKNGFSVLEIKVTKHRIFKFLNGEEGYFDGIILKIN